MVPNACMYQSLICKCGEMFWNCCYGYGWPNYCGIWSRSMLRRGGSMIWWRIWSGLFGSEGVGICQTSPLPLLLLYPLPPLLTNNILVWKKPHWVLWLKTGFTTIMRAFHWSHKSVFLKNKVINLRIFWMNDHDR